MVDGLQFQEHGEILRAAKSGGHFDNVRARTPSRPDNFAQAGQRRSAGEVVERNDTQNAILLGLHEDFLQRPYGTQLDVDRCGMGQKFAEKIPPPGKFEA